MLAARAFAAAGVAALSAAAVGLVTLVATTAAVLASGAASALAAATDSPRSASTLASVVPSTAIPRGRVTFAVSCASARATAATLSGRTLGLTKEIRMRASSPTGEFRVSVVLPGTIRPGTYHPGITCSDGTSTTVRLLVPAFGMAGRAQSGATSTWIAVGGLVLIAVGAAIGGSALRRRRFRRSDQPGPPEPSDRFDYSGHSNFRFLARQDPAFAGLRSAPANRAVITSEMIICGRCRCLAVPVAVCAAS